MNEYGVSPDGPVPTEAQQSNGSDAAPGDPVKRKWGKGKIAGAVGGGCCGVLLLFFVIGLIGAGMSGQLGAKPSASPTSTVAETTTAAPTSEAPETSKAPTSEPTTTSEAPETTTPAPSKEPATTTAAPTKKPEPTKADPQAWADGIANDVITANAGPGKAWSDVCGGTGWCAYVTGVSATIEGQLHVQLQLASGDPQAAQLARSTATFIIMSAAADHPELQWVIVEDATGTVIGQYQPSDFGR